MNLDETITVVIVDDSPLVRRGIRAILETDRRFQILGEGANGEDAVRLAEQLRPRIMILDLDMPSTNGLVAIERIMEEFPTRILIVTSQPSFGGRDSTFEAVSRGALELLPKPTAWPLTPERLDQQSFRRTVALLANIPVVPHVRAGMVRRQRTRDERLTPSISSPGSPRRPVIIGMGASTGGPSITRAILEPLPRHFGIPILLVQHIAAEFAPGYVEWLRDALKLEVSEARNGTVMSPGHLYVAARGPHVTVTAGRAIRGVNDPPRGGHRPSVDVLFESLADTFPDSAVGVLLTGMGQDGATGLRAISKAGSVTIAQDEASCPVFGMPKAAIDLGAVRHVLSPREITAKLLDLGSMGTQESSR